MHDSHLVPPLNLLQLPEFIQLLSLLNFRRGNLRSVFHLKTREI